MGGVGLLLPPCSLSCVRFSLLAHPFLFCRSSFLETLLRKVEDESGDLSRPRSASFGHKVTAWGGFVSDGYSGVVDGNVALRHGGRLSGFRQHPVFTLRPHMPVSYPESNCSFSASVDTLAALLGSVLAFPPHRGVCGTCTLAVVLVRQVEILFCAMLEASSVSSARGRAPCLKLGRVNSLSFLLQENTCVILDLV